MRTFRVFGQYGFGSLGQPGGASNPYLFRDEFTTDAAGPLSSPRTAEPGPGLLTLVQTDGQYSVSSGKLVNTAQGTPVVGDLLAKTALFPRSPGLAALIEITKTSSATTTQYPRFGFYFTATAPFAGGVLMEINFNDTGRLQVINRAAVLTVNIPDGYTANTSYVGAFVTFATGSACFIKGGSQFAAWTLLWVETVTTDANAGLIRGDYDDTTSSDYMRDPANVGGSLTDWRNFATLNQANPTTGTTYTGAADGVYEMNLTLPGSPSAGDTMEMRYRVNSSTPTTDYWTLYLKRNAGNTAWDLLLDSVSGGVATNRRTVTNVGAAVAIRARVTGSNHRIYSRTLNNELVEQGALVTVSHQNTQTLMDATFVVGSVASLISWPLTSALYTQFDSF